MVSSMPATTVSSQILNPLDRQIFSVISDPAFSGPLYLKCSEDNTDVCDPWAHWSHNPHQPTTDRIAEQLSADPTEVYYGVKWLRVRGFVTPDGLVNPNPPKQKGGIVSVSELLSAVSEGREPNYIELSASEPTPVDLLLDRVCTQHLERAAITDATNRVGLLHSLQPLVDGTKAAARIVDRYGEALRRPGWAEAIAEYIDSQGNLIPETANECAAAAYVSWLVSSVGQLAELTAEYRNTLQSKKLPEPCVTDILKDFGLGTGAGAPLLIVRSEDERQRTLALGLEALVWHTVSRSSSHIPTSRPSRHWFRLHPV
jgi:hypothetical protein